MSETEKFEEFCRSQVCTYSAYAIVGIIVYFLGLIIYYGGITAAGIIAGILGVMFACACLGLKLGGWLCSIGDDSSQGRKNSP